MLPIQPHHIIAIGASAGGMEEINSFFDHTPLDGVSYVIIQHLSSDFKSRMVELLARHSKLIVKEAEDAILVKPNEVYLIPSNKVMTIIESRLFLTDKEKIHSPHLTINKFFNSLAADSGSKAIGIILSGLGSDGTEGIKAIKNAGGMVIARNPETTEFGSMPASAIATGLVDFILEPAAMPAAIEDYVKHEEELLIENENDGKNLTAIINLIKEQSPLDFTEYKQPTILRRIKRRAAYNNLAKLEDYFIFLKATPEEVEILAKDFLISVTSFFRDKEAFEFIQTTVLPAILKKLIPTDELKMWVAGCATGEEAYSMAILIGEQLTGSYKDVVVKIFATDIDTSALAHAGKGIYNATVAKDISPERLEKYFLKEGENYKVKPEIRKMVIFAQHDLVKNPPYCNMHLISCRNLLIYMTPALQKKIFFTLLFGLKMEGYLFLGSSENPVSIIQNLEVINKTWKVYRNLETKRVIHFDSFSLPQMADIKNNRLQSSREDIFPKTNNTLAEAVNTIMASKLDHLVVCIDEDNHVVKTYGDTTKYLLQKNFNLNLDELLPMPLALAFNTLSINAKRNNERVAAKGIKIKNGKFVITVNLSIDPINIKNGERLFMVTLNEDKLLTYLQQEDLVYDEKIYLNKYTLMMQEELEALKNKLNSTYEQLDASNDNMQSYNEELLSANEEMQSTNEEMQSVNEELHTINTDYQLKNKELLELNDDLNNYFRSTINGQLFVNNELELMKFSPGTVKQINLLSSDIGRPLSNISTNIKLDTLTEDIKKVLADGSVITKEIETNDGKWYQVMTMPYIQLMDNKRNGAIITFNDITELKKAQVELDKKNKSVLRINDDLDNFVHAAAHDLLAPLGNIEMSVGMLNDLKINDPELTTFLSIINLSVVKFRSLINDMSDIGQVESEMITMEMVDLDEIINNVEWSLDDKIKLTGTVINRTLEIKHIFFSKKNLRSILYNLISNSIKFKSEASPVINIHTIKDGSDIILSIQDNGIGIPKEGVSRVFSIYGRLHGDIEGQGIGLFLAKKIVDAAGGNIILESELGKGSKFIIYFKADQEATAKIL